MQPVYIKALTLQPCIENSKKQDIRWAKTAKNNIMLHAIGYMIIYKTTISTLTTHCLIIKKEKQ